MAGMKQVIGAQVSSEESARGGIVKAVRATASGSEVEQRSGASVSLEAKRARPPPAQLTPGCFELHLLLDFLSITRPSVVERFARSPALSHSRSPGTWQDTITAPSHADVSPFSALLRAPPPHQEVIDKGPPSMEKVDQDFSSRP